MQIEPIGKIDVDREKVDFTFPERRDGKVGLANFPGDAASGGRASRLINSVDSSGLVPRRGVCAPAREAAH